MPDLENWNIVIVDDEPDNIGVLALVFRFHKATVRTAETAEECLKLIREQVPSLLLMDIQMPHVSGFDLLKKIRETESWRGIPIVAISARAMENEIEQGMKAGFDGYITKPINAFTLADEVAKLVETRGKKND